MAQNFLTLFKNTKTRTLVLVVGSTLVAAVGFLISNLGSGSKEVSKENASKVIGVPRESQSVPGAQTSEEYRKLLAEENKKRAEEAEKDKKSALPTFKGPGEGTDPNNPFGPGGANGTAGAGAGAGGRTQFGLAGLGSANDPFGDTSRGGFVGGGNFSAKEQQRQLEEDRQKRLDEQKKRIAEIEEDKRRKVDLELRRKELELADKQYQQSVQESATQMGNYAKGATVSWTTIQPQAYIQGVHADKDKDKDKDKDNNPNAYANTKTESVIIKAGTVLYGVLDTAINSDESGPVLATIVSGKYKGARLLGKIQLPANASKIIINFSTMSLPKKKESLGIEAYAIDPETARTAFASDVDNHYLLRYGSLFASSFMEGFGKAVGQQGTTITDPNGTQTQSKPELSPKQQVYSALGTMGEKWSKQVEPLFKTPVTVTVEQGLGVGILFMRDADVSIRAGSMLGPTAPALVTPPSGLTITTSNSNK